MNSSTDTESRSSTAQTEPLAAGPRRALAAMADTLLPGNDGLPSASELGAVEGVERMLNAGDPRDRAAIGVGLRALEHVIAGRPGRPFSSLPQEAREQRLRKLMESGVPPFMQLSQGVRSLAMLAAHTVAGPGGHNPRAGAMPHELDAPAIGTPLSADVALSCDVVVIGSGAGGGTVAGVLAARGLDVIVLEEGDGLEGHPGPESEFDRVQRTFRSGGAFVTSGDGTVVQAARCVGGGTAVNYTASYDLPQSTRDEWTANGLGEVFGPNFDIAKAEVSRRLSLTTDHSCLSPRDEAVGGALNRLGWSHYATQRNVNGCDDEICAKCSLGCPRGAKQDQAHTYLADLIDKGGRLFTRARVTKIQRSNGRATGVEAQTADGDTVEVRSRAVVLAAGTLMSPVLLERSGLSSHHLGRNLHLQPATFIAGIFDRIMGPTRGSLLGWTCNEFTDLDSHHHGVEMASSATNLATFALFMPWEGSERYAELLSSFERVASITHFLREEGEGRVRVSRSGLPRIAHKLTDGDHARLQTGIRRAAELLAEAGAEDVLTAHRRPVRWQPKDGADKLQAALDHAGQGPGRVGLGSVHPVGTARMSTTAKNGCVDPDGRWWGTENLYLADASVLPGAPGVAPMVTISTVAHRIASGLAASLS